MQISVLLGCTFLATPKNGTEGICGEQGLGASLAAPTVLGAVGQGAPPTSPKNSLGSCAILKPHIRI